MADLERISQRARELAALRLDGIQSLWEAGEVRLRLEAGPGPAVKLAALIVSDKARRELPGAGAAALSGLCQACDEAGAPIELLAKPLPKPREPGMPARLIPLSKLVEFYARHGFKAAPGQTSPTSARMRRG